MSKLLMSYVLRAIGLYAPFEFGKRTLIRTLGEYSFDRTRVIRARRAGVYRQTDYGAREC